MSSRNLGGNQLKERSNHEQSGSEGKTSESGNKDEEEKDEIDDESQEESISSASVDYESDRPGLMAHRERRSERSYDRFVAEKCAMIEKLRRKVDWAATRLSESNEPCPIAAPPDDAGVFGRWGLYSPRYLGDEYHDHRLWLGKGAPGKPVYDDNGDSVEGISFEILIEDDGPGYFQCEGVMPFSTYVPNHATLEPFLIPLAEVAGASCAVLHTQAFADVVFLGDGYVKLCLPIAFLESRLRNGSRLAFDARDEKVEFIGRKVVPRHLQSKQKTPPSPREPFAGWLAGYD